MHKLSHYPLLALALLASLQAFCPFTQFSPNDSYSIDVIYRGVDNVYPYYDVTAYAFESMARTYA
jgi:hypothetical protein